jgi:hypothetical protein
MKKLLFIFLLLFQVSKINAQTGVYKTYEDYVNKNLISMDTIIDFEIGSFSGAKITFLNSERKNETYKAKQMWGFVFVGHLFRSIGLDIAEVIDTGKVCYYESGISHLRSIMDHTTSGYFRYGGTIYLSKNLNSKYYDTYKKFCKENAEFNSLKDCLDENKTKPKMSSSGGDVYLDYTQVFIEFRKCVSKFNSH